MIKCNKYTIKRELAKSIPVRNIVVDEVEYPGIDTYRIELKLPNNSQMVGYFQFSSFYTIDFASIASQFENALAKNLANVLFIIEDSTIGIEQAFQGMDMTEVIMPNEISGCSVLKHFEFDDGRGRPLRVASAMPMPRSIGLLAFAECTSLQRVVIPDSVAEIGSWTFKGCTSLRNIVIPDSVTKIGDGAFANCTSLQRVVIPDSVTEISPSTFEGCTSLKHVLIPDSVTEICFEAFKNCTSLQCVVVSESDTEIDDTAFQGCNLLQGFTDPDNYNELDQDVFEDCTSPQDDVSDTSPESIDMNQNDGLKSLIQQMMHSLCDKNAKNALSCILNIPNLQQIYDSIDKWQSINGSEELELLDASLDKENKAIERLKKNLQNAGSAQIPNVKELQTLSNAILKNQRIFAQAGVPLFKKCCLTNVRIDMYRDGFVLSEGRPTIGAKAGLYLHGDRKKCESSEIHLSTAILQDLKDAANSVLSRWQNLLKANDAFWDLVKQSDTFSNISTLNKSNVEILTEIEALEETKCQGLDKIKADLSRHEEQKHQLSQKLKELKSLDPNKAISVIEESVQKYIQQDPLLSGFALIGEDDIYDTEWLGRVKKAAENRSSLPFLPLMQWDSLFAFVHDWKEVSGHNFIIDTEKEEDENQRLQLLDNFVATLLLAYPVKKLHFTIIEHHQVNPFVSDLHEKICTLYDIRDNSAEVRNYIRNLKDMNRSGKSNPLEKCTPREVVILSGFEKEDREFVDLLRSLEDVIRDGWMAGIYFVINTTFDHNSKGDGAQIPYAEYFNYYGTIYSFDTDDEVTPFYDLLRSEAKLENGSGTLGDLILEYVEKEVTTTPNAVYTEIENGQLYQKNPIQDLGHQPRNEADNLVVPIAQTEDGEEIDMRLNATDFISYFILGRSGMGKSFTLHTILTNMMLKYDPSVVDIILMDFKPGGVEMNYYKDIPHVSKLLVNGADKQVALEILQSIMKEMDRRGEIFQECDVASINTYNAYARRNGREQMKHIVMLVDECQDLFKVQNPGSENHIVTDIARKGRSYGIHMILATQTLQGADIPGDALAQFSDFLFMGCKEDDVIKCEINDRAVQRQVNTLTKGEVIYCHRAAEPVHGYVFNFAGKDGLYREKTHQNLLSSRFTPAKEKQFYFNASQIYNIGKEEFSDMAKKAVAGTKPMPLAILGKALSIKGEPVYSRMRRGEGSNLLILGANEKLQSERILWNALLSTYYTHMVAELPAKYFIMPNFPEEVSAEAREATENRNTLLRKFSKLRGVELIDEYDRAHMIEEIAATVRQRTALADTDRRAIDNLDKIYLIVPNQQLFYTRMSKAPRGTAKSLDGGSNIGISPISSPTPSNIQANTDMFGFESLDGFGEEPKPTTSSTPGFMDIEMGFGSSQPNMASVSTGRPGRDLNEELKQILVNGPMVNVHVFLHSTTPDKIYSDDMLRQGEMQLCFNDMVFLRMLQADRMSLPVDSRLIEKLSSDPRSLRAIVYNGERGHSTVVPYDLTIEEFFSFLND